MTKIPTILKMEEVNQVWHFIKDKVNISSLASLRGIKSYVRFQHYECIWVIHLSPHYVKMCIYCLRLLDICIHVTYVLCIMCSLLWCLECSHINMKDDGSEVSF